MVLDRLFSCLCIGDGEVFSLDSGFVGFLEGKLNFSVFKNLYCWKYDISPPPPPPLASSSPLPFPPFPRRSLPHCLCPRVMHIFIQVHRLISSCFFIYLPSGCWEPEAPPRENGCFSLQAHEWPNAGLLASAFPSLPALLPPPSPACPQAPQPTPPSLCQCLRCVVTNENFCALGLEI